MQFHREEDLDSNMDIKTIISIVVAGVSFLWDCIITALYIWHYKKGHKQPNAEKIEQKRLKTELKATYKAGLKALKNKVVESEGKK